MNGKFCFPFPQYANDDEITTMDISSPANDFGANIPTIKIINVKATIKKPIYQIIELNKYSVSV